VAGLAGSSGPKDYFLASGRWDNTVIVIDVTKALDPANDGTPNAVTNRLRVTPPTSTPMAPGNPTPWPAANPSPWSFPQPSAAPMSPTIPARPRRQAASFQHGWPGTYTVLDLSKALDPANNGTLNRGCRLHRRQELAPPVSRSALITNTQQQPLPETPDSEDGGSVIGIVDLATNKVIRQVQRAYGKPDSHVRSRDTACLADRRSAALPAPMASPSARWAAEPFSLPMAAPTMLGVISLQKALAGDAGAELARIPMQTGGFGISTSPDGKLVAVASREDLALDKPGNTISIINVEKALTDPARAEVARLLLGTDDPSVGTRPFVAAFTPDGKRIVVTHFRTNNISIVDVGKALAGQPAEIKRLPLVTPDGSHRAPRSLSPRTASTPITSAPKAGPIPAWCGWST
jgi:hypothetical protein